MKLVRSCKLKYLIAGFLCLLLNSAQAEDINSSDSRLNAQNATPSLNLPDTPPPIINQQNQQQNTQEAKEQNSKVASPKPAQPVEQKLNSVQEQLRQSELPSDVRILIDISGSMKETDPKNLRKAALKLLANLMPDETRAGAWTFGRYVNMLVPLGEVNEAWKKQASAKAEQINSAGLRTNLTGVLEKARFQEDAEKYQKSIILLTDGKIDMADEGNPEHPDNKAARKKLINEILPFYAQKGIKIHTLALSEKADTQLLQKIALETDGLYLKVDDPEALPKIFLKAFERSVPVEQVPLEDNRFDIDESIKEFTALIFRKENAQKTTTLIQPDGKVISAQSSDNVNWYKGLNFDLVTVKSPQPGKWSLDADLNPDNRVQILTDLSLQVLGVPSSLFSGKPVLLQAGLTNKGEIVTEKTLLQLTDVMLSVTNPEGKTQSKLISNPEDLPKDGLFKQTLADLKTQGEYRFEIIANGRTFKRRQVITASLLEPIKVKVDVEKEAETVNIGVYPKSDLVDVDLSRVILNVTMPNGSSELKTLNYDKQETAWKYQLKPETPEGDYSVLINIRGVSQGGKPFRSEPEMLRFSFPLNKPEVSEPVPEKIDDVEQTDSNVEVSSDKPEAKPEEAPAEPEPAPELEAKPAPEEESEPTTPEPELEALVEPEETEQNEPEEDPFADDDPFVEEEEQSSGSLWIYLAIGFGVLALSSGVFVWWFRNQKRDESFSELAEEEGFNLNADEDEEREDPVLGNFEDFDGEKEVPVFSESEQVDEMPDANEQEPYAVEDEPEESEEPKPAEEVIEEPKEEPEEKEELDSEFNIDPDEELPDADGWGEFDKEIQEEQSPEPESEPNPEEIKGEEADKLMAELAQEEQADLAPADTEVATDAEAPSDESSEEDEKKDT